MVTGAAPAVPARTMVLPLALAQFIASYAATNMNVAIGDIAHDLGTGVAGLQATITLFTLTMASLMIPGSKLTDIWGRKACFVAGLVTYGVGALLAALAPGLGTARLFHLLEERNRLRGTVRAVEAALVGLDTLGAERLQLLPSLPLLIGPLGVHAAKV